MNTTKANHRQSETMMEKRKFFCEHYTDQGHLDRQQTFTNKYIYGLSNPINFSDPYGLSPEGDGVISTCCSDSSGGNGGGSSSNSGGSGYQDMFESWIEDSFEWMVGMMRDGYIRSMMQQHRAMNLQVPLSHEAHVAEIVRVLNVDRPGSDIHPEMYVLGGGIIGRGTTWAARGGVAAIRFVEGSRTASKIAYRTLNTRAGKRLFEFAATVLQVAFLIKRPAT